MLFSYIIKFPAHFYSSLNIHLHFYGMDASIYRAKGVDNVADEEMNKFRFVLSNRFNMRVDCTIHEFSMPIRPRVYVPKEESKKFGDHEGIEGKKEINEYYNRKGDYPGSSGGLTILEKKKARGNYSIIYSILFLLFFSKSIKLPIR